MVAVQRVPDDDDAVDVEAQRHGALHAVAGLADAEQLFVGGEGSPGRPAVLPKALCQMLGVSAISTVSLRP